MEKKGNRSRCTICGKTYQNTPFMGGYVCEDCISYISSVSV